MKPGCAPPVSTTTDFRPDADDRPLRRARDPRPERSRGRSDGPPGDAGRARPTRRTGLRAPAARCRSGCRHIARGAGPPAGHAQARTARAPEGRSRHRPVRRPRRHRLGRGAQARAARATRVLLAGADLRTGRARRRLLAHGTGPVRRRVSRRRPRPQRVQLPLHAGRRDDGFGRARGRLHGLSGRDRADRDAGPGDRRHAARRLHRHAELPQAAPREGRRTRHPAGLAEEGVGRRRGVSAVAARLVPGPRHRGVPELRHRGSRPRRVRDLGARRPRARRRRAARDRAARHRRSGARRRRRRGRRDDLQSRLPADPLRHRRPVGGARRARARPAAPTRASRAGSAAPTRRPRCAACSCIRARSPRSCAGTRP